MGCYILPTIAAILVHAIRKKGNRHDEEGAQLNLLLAGGAIFGLVDHWWNGELYPPVGADIASDMLLGLLITTSIYAVWFGMLLLKQSAARKPQRAVV